LNFAENTSANGEKSKKKVGVLLSGGVDSAVALYLLLKEGYDVTAYHMKLLEMNCTSAKRSSIRYVAVHQIHMMRNSLQKNLEYHSK